LSKVRERDLNHRGHREAQRFTEKSREKKEEGAEIFASREESG
jgi:hypothetical protein